jgi:hypothetical protein
MKMSIAPTSLGLVGIIFICILAGSASSLTLSDAQEQLNKFKDDSIHSLRHGSSPEWGMLQAGEETIYFPWHSSSKPGRPAFGSVSMSPVREEIIMDSTNSSASVGDLLAINTIKERDVLQKSSQEGDPDDLGLSNDLMIDVSGVEGQGTDASNYKVGAGRTGFEDRDLRYPGNYLTVNVHDITVSAVNSMPDGNAVATSNIIIEPVQTIVIPSEVNQKLC